MSNIVLAIVMVAATFPRPANAECVLLDPLTVSRQAAAVFSGTVTHIDFPTITFDVDRVWKGPVTKLFSIYSIENRLGEFNPTLGTKYLVFAMSASEDERFHLGLRDRRAFVLRECGSGTRRWQLVSRGQLKALGISKSPSRNR